MAAAMATKAWVALALGSPLAFQAEGFVAPLSTAPVDARATLSSKSRSSRSSSSRRESALRMVEGSKKKVGTTEIGAVAGGANQHQS